MTGPDPVRRQPGDGPTNGPSKAPEARFVGSAMQQQVDKSMGAALLLHSSCQGLIEASLEPVDAPWCDEINNALGEAETLVVDWRHNGFLYFQQDMLTQVIACGQAFLNAKSRIDGLFDALDPGFTATTRAAIASALNGLASPIARMGAEMTAYGQKLTEFQMAMQKPHAEMNRAIAQIQASEADIKAKIGSINARIAKLRRRVSDDRRAIAEATKKRSAGIVETVFGVVFAPLTGGISLILAGIGVASLAGAEQQIEQLRTTIADAQAEVVADQSELTDDQKQIATLRGLALSVELALEDITSVGDTLARLRTTWGVLQGELDGTVAKITAAETAKDALVGQVWFDAACGEWQSIVTAARALQHSSTPMLTRIPIGS